MSIFRSAGLVEYGWAGLSDLLKTERLTGMTYDKMLEQADAMLAVKASSTHNSYMEVLQTFDHLPAMADVVAYTNGMLERGLKGTTIQQRHAAIRWLIKHFPREFDPVEAQEICNYMSEIKIAPFIPAVATPQQVEEILSKADPRTALVVSFLYYHGLRVCDVAKLQLSDFKEDADGRIHFVVGHKKNKEIREYLLLDKIAPLFHAYVDGQRKETILGWKSPHDTSSLFLSRRGNLSIRRMQELVTGICDSLDYNNLTCHSFRHGCGTAYAKAGAGVEAIRYALGHKSVASSMRYIHLSANDLDSIAQGVF